MKRQMMTIGGLMLAAVIVNIAASAPVHAQQSSDSGITWVTGPATGDLGNATIKVPQGYRFTGPEGTEIFLKNTGNTYNGDLGILQPIPAAGSRAAFFIVFDFRAEGYVKDDEKDKLNDSFAADLLKQLQESQVAGNKDRTSQGMEPLTISGWSQKPFYDDQTKNLTWGLIVSSPSGSSINYESRVLGRRGYMNANMVLSEANVAKSVPEFRKIIGGIAYKSGETYAEFKSGDKVAEYGLLGLASGGLAIAAVKWWKPLMKFGIFIVAGIALAIKKVFSMFKSKAAPTA